ncbi:MAG: hypothetical protein OXE78_05390 [Gammaproteobacteria bacterium]|nr:hypothetical protein [Gammaproteobacteria bacterium]MCY4356350.1 hypothetical protein [Gammaproteobacteria bacterium]
MRVPGKETIVQTSDEYQASKKSGRIKDDQAAALLVAQTFIVFSAIYWFLQIESVRELLQLAYG